MTGRNEPKTAFQTEFSEEVWDTTYKYHEDKTVDDTMYRTAKGLAQAEKTPELKQYWTGVFYEMLSGFKVTAGGRIYSNAGTAYAGTTLFNCYTTSFPTHDIDSVDGINKLLNIQAQTLKSEGGWGCNFSHIRPRGAKIEGIGAESPGTVKFMELFDVSSEIITSGSGIASTDKTVKKKIRKGAMMGVLDVTHPSIFEFITAKQTPGRLTKFNLSVNCTDAFMEKVNIVSKMRLEGITSGAEYDEADKWDLIFPDTKHSDYKTRWTGDIEDWVSAELPVIVYETVSAYGLWELIMKSTHSRNEPGVLFLGAANRYASSTYHPAEKIRATNPCLPADSWIQTSEGPKLIRDLIGKQFKARVDGVDYLTGSEGFFKTATKEVVCIETNEGYSVRLTPDHEVRKVVSFNEGRPVTEWCAAETLLENDQILLNDHRTNTAWQGEGDLTEDQAYTLGMLVGDGTIKKNGTAILSVWTETVQEANGGQIKIPPTQGLQDVMDLIEGVVRDLPHRDIFKGWFDIKGRGEYRITTTALSQLASDYGLVHGNKTITDQIEYTSSDAHVGFLRGLFDADGSVQGKPSCGVDVRLAQSDVKLLERCQRMLLRLGIPSKIYKNRRHASERLMPDGKGGKKLYQTKANHELVISKGNILRYSTLIGFRDSRKHEKLLDLISLYTKTPRNPTFTARVLDVVPDTTEDVYDVQVPGINTFDAFGLHVHNCGEQLMPSGLYYDDSSHKLMPTSGICCLSSINMTQFVNSDHTGFDLEDLADTVRSLVRFLDNVNEVAQTPLAVYDYARDHKRRIGIGVMGWGSALYMLKIRFGSDKAEELKEEFMGIIAREAYKASIDLAEERGMYTYCDPEKHASTEFIKRLNLPKEYLDKLRKVGIRNSSLLSIQPTGNSSIFANMASGGLEPVFMPEYIRTSIVSAMPDEIKDVCPKWYEGEFHETELFKFVKEGDETILRGVGPTGTVYKIDKNRGLVKETLCEDYGVRYMKARGEWDASANWACSTTDLSVNEHLVDMKGFAYWIDSSMSKTVNLPEDYPFETFKDLYLDGYNSGVLKGLTSYRANSMTSVLSAKDEATASDDEEEIILEDVKLPEIAPAEIKTLRAEGKKYYVTTSFFEDTKRPFAMFVKSNYSESSAVADEAVDLLIELARSKGIPPAHINDQISKMSKDNNANKVARAISLCLRHGVFIRNIVATLDKSENAVLGSFTSAIKKHLSAYIKEGEPVENSSCSECGGDMKFEGGCELCVDCGAGACS